MILFQYIALPLLGALLALEAYCRLSGRDRSLANLGRFCLWLAAFLAIAWPDQLTLIARRIGITRGADLVLYLFVLAFLATTFYFYSRYTRVQSQLTKVVRHLAISEARRTEAPPGTQGTDD